VTCCTIDWFSEWPDEALKSVATNFLQDITEIDDPDTIPGLVSAKELLKNRLSGFS
jgi:dynein heavy chain